MRYLLDTHILLWWLAGDKRLPKQACKLVEDRNNLIFYSAASFWESAIKISLGRLSVDLQEVQEKAEENGFSHLDVKIQHTIELQKVPQHHNDPFDRMLVAQCSSEGLRLISCDKALKQYGQIVLAF